MGDDRSEQCDAEGAVNLIARSFTPARDRDVTRQERRLRAPFHGDSASTSDEIESCRKADAPVSESERALRGLVAEFATAARSRVCRAVMSKLRRLPGMLEGSLLRNAWDEICVQMQGQHSIHLEAAYIPTVEDFVCDGIKKLSASEKRAIWLQTTEGDRWVDDPDAETWRGFDGLIPYDEDSISAAVLDEVLAVAVNYENSRIRAFLDISVID